MEKKRFPVLLYSDERRKFPHIPRFVPWGFIAKHTQQVHLNHGQSLQRLADRGGLGPSEMYAVVFGLLRPPKMDEAQAWELLKPLLEAFVSGEHDEQ